MSEEHFVLKKDLPCCFMNRWNKKKEGMCIGMQGPVCDTCGFKDRLFVMKEGYR